MFVTNWISTTKIQKISEITNFFKHYFLSRTEVIWISSIALSIKQIHHPQILPHHQLTILIVLRKKLKDKIPLGMR